MAKRAALILGIMWVLLFSVMGLELIPRNQIYYAPLNLYGWLVCRMSPFQVVYPAQVATSSRPQTRQVQVILPWDEKDYTTLLTGDHAKHPRTLVVCSNFDSYMVRHYDQAARWGDLERVVVFDGGHHLATLATEPQILLVPEAGGCAAHTYMQDAMPVDNIVKILRQLNASTLVVTMPRWGLAKCQLGLTAWISRLGCYPVRQPAPTSDLISGQHYAIRQGIALAYVLNPGEACRLEKVLKSHRQRFHRLYLAFNYGQVPPPMAERVSGELARTLGVRVEVVNQPRTAFKLRLKGKQ